MSKRTPLDQFDSAGMEPGPCFTRACGLDHGRAAGLLPTVGQLLHLRGGRCRQALCPGAPLLLIEDFGPDAIRDRIVSYWCWIIPVGHEGLAQAISSSNCKMQPSTSNLTLSLFVTATFSLEFRLLRAVSSAVFGVISICVSDDAMVSGQPGPLATNASLQCGVMAPLERRKVSGNVVSSAGAREVQLPKDERKKCSEWPEWPADLKVYEYEYETLMDDWRHASWARRWPEAQNTLPVLPPCRLGWPCASNKGSRASAQVL